MSDLVVNPEDKFPNDAAHLESLLHSIPVLLFILAKTNLFSPSHEIILTVILLAGPSWLWAEFVIGRDA